MGVRSLAQVIGWCGRRSVRGRGGGVVTGWTPMPQEQQEMRAPSRCSGEVEQDGTGAVAWTLAGAQGHTMGIRFLGREWHGRRRTGWAGDRHGGADTGGGAGAGDADTVIGEGAAWGGKVQRSSATGKPMAALVGIVNKEADGVQPLDTR